LYLQDFYASYYLYQTDQEKNPINFHNIKARIYEALNNSINTYEIDIIIVE